MRTASYFVNPWYDWTVTINNEPYFVGKDVADIFGYQNVDEEDKLKYRFGTSGQYREMTIIKEPFPHVSKETCLRGYNIMKMTGRNVLSKVTILAP